MACNRYLAPFLMEEGAEASVFKVTELGTL